MGRTHIEDITGRIFNKLTVLGEDGYDNYNHLLWRCRCECGNYVSVAATKLTHNKTVSCGCAKRSRIIAASTTHGKTGTTEHDCWKGIKFRCYNTNCKAYPNYGGRGIVVCDRWLESFENFLTDMGPKPKPHRKYSIERKDNGGNYEPGNCIWADRTTQNKNTRQNYIVLTEHGLHSINETARLSGISASTLKQRVRLGWTDSQLLNLPR